MILIEVRFRKRSKIRTMLWKIKKVGILDIFVVNSINFVSLFFLFGSFILQRLSWFEQKLGLVCQTTCLFVVSWIFGGFEANFNKQRPLSFQKGYLFKIAYRRYQISHHWVFLTIQCKEAAQNVYKKGPEIVKKNLNPPIFPRIETF